MSLKQVSIVSFFTKPSLKPRTILSLETLNAQDGETAEYISQTEEGTEEPLLQRREAQKSPKEREKTEEFSSQKKKEQLSSQRISEYSTDQDRNQKDGFESSEVGLNLIKSVIVNGHTCIDKKMMQNEMKSSEIVENELYDGRGNTTSVSELNSEHHSHSKRNVKSLSKLEKVKKGSILKDEEENNEPPLLLEEAFDTNAIGNPSTNAGCFPIEPTTACNATTEYERVREENVRRNRVLLEKLGISSSALFMNNMKDGSNFKSKSLAKRKSTMSSIAQSSPLPLRRSRRLLQDVSVDLDVNTDVVIEPTKRHKTSSIDQNLHEDTIICYDDSSVLKYTCGETMDATKFYFENGPTKSELDSGKILGFKSSCRFLQAMHLTRIYTMNICYPVYGGHRGLLAAGGHQGQVAIFGIDMITEDSDCAETMVDDTSHDSGPLMSWKGGNGWISGVKFIVSHAKENSVLLLSSANDGKLVLWDVNKQQKQHSSTRSTPPLKLTEVGDIHSNGIFSMDEIDSHIATASKDSAIGYSRIADQEILRDRSISGHHCGPIRGVSFRNKNLMADCGADGLICILDMRISEPLVISIDTKNATGVNVAEWCPSQEYLLLSASKDPHISLYDIRNPNNFLHKLSGHIDPRLQKCSHIYRPTFVDQGRVVASPGQGSKAVSLYCVETGKAISKGHLGYDPNMVLWSSSGCNNSPSLWVASRSISELIPLRQC